MRIDIVTAFPNLFKNIFCESIIKRAQEKSLLRIKVHDLRHFSSDKRQTIDDRPYGGGPGMVLLVEPLYKAYDSIRKEIRKTKPSTIILSPQGETFSQTVAEKLSREENLILICGHYEGFDERIINLTQAEEISIGNYVLSGGEIPAMVIVDTVTRLLPEVLGDEKSLLRESFGRSDPFLLDFPNFSTPRKYKGQSVPEVLLNGDHKKIENWRVGQAIKKTREKRPDLMHLCKEHNITQRPNER